MLRPSKRKTRLTKMEYPMKHNDQVNKKIIKLKRTFRQPNVPKRGPGIYALWSRRYCQHAAPNDADKCSPFLSILFLRNGKEEKGEKGANQAEAASFGVLSIFSGDQVIYTSTGSARGFR
jgi:hypothetical protein